MRDTPTVTESRRSVLDALKHRGDATADELADELGITVAGARQHLNALIDEGLVSRREDPREAGTRGRPTLRYALTRRTEPLFPKAYDELANDLLGFVAAEDADLVARVFERRRDARIDNARQRLATKRGWRARVAELAAILDEDGYLAEWQHDDDGTFRIIEHNCAILAVAERHPHACTSEIEFLRAVLGDATVERVQHIVAGAHQCAYLITPTSAAAARGRATDRT